MSFSSSKTNKTVKKSHTKNNYGRVLAHTRKKPKPSKLHASYQIDVIKDNHWMNAKCCCATQEDTSVFACIIINEHL